MVRNLYLLRHGQAEHHFGDKDFERNLTHEGIAKLATLAVELRQQGFYPDKVYCSTSVRTRQTCDLITEEIDYVLPVDFKDEIYEASVKTLFDLVCGTPDEVETLLLIGHNPALSFLFEYFTGKNFPGLAPGDLMKIVFGVDSWSEVSKGTGKKERI